MLALCLTTLAEPTYGQNVTTGSLTGAVRDSQGGALPGVTVTATHTPTGATYEGVTQGDGTFTLVNVRIGGPYDIGATLAGFRDGRQSGVIVNLGQATSVDLTLQLASVSETVVVTAIASSVFTSTNSGTSANIEQAVIENLPTIQRSLTDFARANPFFAPSNTNANSGTALSVAGRSGRYNNLQIDGAVNNDLFGLADSALPGGLANTEPISLAAIQELQLVVSPYDVRQGNFSGGGINAITKSGTNAMRGTVLLRSEIRAGLATASTTGRSATFNDKQFGGSLGGPSRANNAILLRQRRVAAARNAIRLARSMARPDKPSAGRQTSSACSRYSHSRYGYDPGPITEFIRQNPNDKVFVRADFNLTPSHQLTVRHNYIDALNDVGTISNTRYFFPDQFYEFTSNANSTVGQLNSALSKWRERSARHVSANPRHQGQSQSAIPTGQHPHRRRAGRSLRYRAVLRAQRAQSGHRRDQRRLDARARAAPVDVRHAQRALQVRQSLHPRQLRHLRLQQHRPVRAGPRAVLRLQLLEHVGPTAVGQVLRLSTGLLCR